jgi:hypothetical protein
VSGWWLPMVMVVAVMPGADAVRAALEVLVGVVVEVELDEHAVTVSPAAAIRAVACQRSR